MATITRARTVSAPPMAVWEALSDFGSIGSWASNVDHSCLLSPADQGIGIGTTRRVQVGRNTLVERITDIAAPSSLGYDVEGLPSLLGRVANRWEIRPNGTGRSEVTLTSTVEIADNPVAGIAEHAICRIMARQSDQMLAGLARRVESTHV